jgi:hypothetical protein
MLIAQQKFKDNTAEYLLYMFQIEHIIRSSNFDLNLIMDVFVRPTLVEKSLENQYKDWYIDLINQMQSQGLEKDGHLDSLKEIIIELIYLHNSLLSVVNDEKYLSLVSSAAEDLLAFKEKSNFVKRHDIEALLHAMNMKLQLKIRKQQITPETELAMDKMRVQLAYLSREYGRMKTGNSNFIQN